MLTVLHAVASEVLDADALALLAQLQATDTATISPTVLLPEGSRLAPLLEEHGISLVTYPAGHRLGRIRMLSRAIRRIAPDILHAHGFPGALLAGMLAGVKRRIFTSAPASAPLRHSRFSTVSVTPYEKRGAGGHTRFIPSGVMPLAPLSREEKHILRETLGIPREAPILGLFDSLDTTSVLPLLFSLLPSLEKRGHPVYLFVFGEGGGRASLAEEAKRRALEDRVLFFGAPPEPAPYCNLLSLTLGVGTSARAYDFITSAMSLGVPPIVKESPLYPSVANGENGYRLPALTRPLLEETIARLLSSPWEHTLLSSRAATSFQKFAARKTAEAYEDLYLSLT